MNRKTATVYARIEPDIKERAEDILSTIGVSPSELVNMVYRQIILRNGLPFTPEIPSGIKDMDTMSKEEFDYELNKGYQAMLDGDTHSTKELFDELKKHGYKGTR